MAELDPLAFQKGFAATQSMFDSARQNRLADLAFAQKEREIGQANALNDLYRTAINPDGTVDQTKLISGAASGGLGSQIPALQKQFTEQAKSQGEARKLQLENGLKQNDAMGQLFGGVRDQASYDAARQQAVSVIGPEAAAKIPAVYDPNEVAQGQARAMSVKDRMTQELQRLQFGETQRHNQVTEGLTGQGQQLTMRGQDLTAQTAQQGQAVTMRGQNMTNERAKEANANKPPTEFQGKSAGYGARAEEADRIIGSLGTSASSASVNAKQAAGRVPLIGGALEMAGNAALSPQSQQLEQAQRDFVNAVLRQESGAAISQGEFENAKRQYFPQPGDSEALLEQKAANRKLAIEGFKRSAGNAAFSSPGVKAAEASSPQKVSDKAAFDALPSGSLFVAPDGTTRRKP